MTMSLDSYGRSGARILWRGLRLPALLFLVLLEPVVTFVLWSLALLGLLMTLFYRAIGMPHFPFWTMLTISLLFARRELCLSGSDSAIGSFAVPLGTRTRQCGGSRRLGPATR